MPREATAAEQKQGPSPVEQTGRTCGALRERSTTMESTTTSLQAVPSEPTTVASSAPAGERTTVPIAAQDADPARGATDTSHPAFQFRTHMTSCQDDTDSIF